MMKYIIALIVLLAGVSAVSAATGSTSTGSTSTGSTSTGGTSTGIVIPTLPAVQVGAGGVTRGFNVTTQSFDLVPQCFPWVWLLEYYKGNIFSMYENQNKCRAQRLIDFGM